MPDFHEKTVHNLPQNLPGYLPHPVHIPVPVSSLFPIPDILRKIPEPSESGKVSGLFQHL